MMTSRKVLSQLRVCLAGTVLAAGVGFPVPADAGDDFPPAIDAVGRAEILSWISETLAARYVDPDLAGTMVDAIRGRAAAGGYDGLDGADGFLHAVEQDLRAVSGDKHVGLWSERLEDINDDDADYTPADPEYVEHLRRTNYGFKRVEILPANIGYVRIDEFAHPALGGATAVAVMNAVGSVDALIVDLRWNGGGAGLVNLISGYFFDEPTRLNDVWERSTEETLQGWTPEYLPGPSLSQVPLYILISGQTFSAAEDFAYGLQQAGRATVVGELSKGGGHPVEIVRLVREGMAVTMMVPNARSVNRLTGTSWDAVGVTPDIGVSASRALEAAYEAAADALRERASDDGIRRRVEWARQEFRAGLSPVSLTRAQLNQYAGSYETRSFAVGDEDVLLYERDTGSAFPLVFMGNDVFRFEGYDEVRFQFGRDDSGSVDRVITLAADGSRSVRWRSD